MACNGNRFKFGDIWKTYGTEMTYDFVMEEESTEDDSTTPLSVDSIVSASAWVTDHTGEDATADVIDPVYPPPSTNNAYVKFIGGEPGATYYVEVVLGMESGDEIMLYGYLKIYERG